MCVCVCVCVSKESSIGKPNWHIYTCTRAHVHAYACMCTYGHPRMSEVLALLHNTSCAHIQMASQSHAQNDLHGRSVTYLSSRCCSSFHPIGHTSNLALHVRNKQDSAA